MISLSAFSLGVLDQALKLPPKIELPKLVAAAAISKSLLPPSTVVAAKMREVRVSINRKSIAIWVLDRPAETDCTISPIKPMPPMRAPDASSSNSVTDATMTISAPSISPKAAPELAVTRPAVTKSCSDNTASKA